MIIQLIKKLLITILFSSIFIIIYLYNYEIKLLNRKVRSEKYLQEYLNIYKVEPPKNFYYKKKERDKIKFDGDWGPYSERNPGVYFLPENFTYLNWPGCQLHVDFDVSLSSSIPKNPIASLLPKKIISSNLSITPPKFIIAQ